MITVDEINNFLSMSANDEKGLLVALLENQNLELQNVFSLDGEHYFYMLKKMKEERLKVHKNSLLVGDVVYIFCHCLVA